MSLSFIENTSDVSTPRKAKAQQNAVADWFDLLRQKWIEVPGAAHIRFKTSELLDLTDRELLEVWSEAKRRDTTGVRFSVRGWYHLLYKDVLKGKRVLDFGCGFGVDGIIFAQNGAHVTFVDIVESNLSVVRRLCDLLGLSDVNFCYMEDISSLTNAGMNYDVIWSQGSLINAPFFVIRAEVQELLRRLKPGGRWIELAYPKTRWEREGCLPFDQWGEKTDGAGTPWVEWYDLRKMQALFEPVKFDVVLYFEFHNGDFNWFDLVRRT